MLSTLFRAALRGAVRCRAAVSMPKLQNYGFSEEKRLVGGLQSSYASEYRGICSTVSSMRLNQYVRASPIVPDGSLLTKSVETTVLNGYTPTRTVVKFTKSQGKRQCVKTVLKRFYRLNWGIWIRTKAGRHKRRWKKSGANARRSRQHVFCNATQSWLLDKMVTPFWRKPKYWVDDPYAPYHKREEYWATRTTPSPVIRKPPST
ncbi:39S ribosomal protein L35, mitochondrial [Diachasma alloeum]|uniref:39S ribosomal protein L35, mitochondrial n=1 Tax=Diachasma alloeum TaxID=454923 RepID=UPI0007383375|nr:39S ribosomal protein L35, mitochondrial [Diachasma alloeum]